jgi:branched-chain amino acid transport system ATP-binding protein
VLSVENLTSAYGRIEALHGVSIEVGAGEIVTLVGANGAGKTTLLRAISGVQPITAGSIRFDGKPIERLPSQDRVAAGITQVPEGRQLFAPLTVEDNLKLGAWSRRGVDMTPEIARVYALFPMLDARRSTPAGALSGGQQQMLAIGRALMASPRLLLLDEPSMGLAPAIADLIFDRIAELHRDSGVTLLLVEQRVAEALESCDYGYVLETGGVVLQGTHNALMADERVRRAYLGM